MVQRADKEIRRALVIAAKPPRVGEVKTRLCPSLSLSQACALYECLLGDIISKMERYQGADFWIAFAPRGSRYFSSHYGNKKLMAQRGRDLGKRLQHIFTELFLKGYQEVIVADSDSPTVPLSSVDQTYDLLDGGGCDVVLGPSRDGGYYLIGLAAAHPSLFRQIPWSSSAVLEKTMERASQLRLKVALLPLAYDIDAAEDLQRLWSDFKETPELRDRAPRTHTFLARFILNK